jgi:hypothetical protein
MRLSGSPVATGRFAPHVDNLKNNFREVVTHAPVIPHSLQAAATRNP